jgi:cell division protein FtsA
MVITGGAANVVGCLDLAERVFKMPVRLGVPYNSGLPEAVTHSMHATGVGLLLYGHQQQYERRAEPTGIKNVKGVLGRMRTWFQSNF